MLDSASVPTPGERTSATYPELPDCLYDPRLLTSSLVTLEP